MFKSIMKMFFKKKTKENVVEEYMKQESADKALKYLESGAFLRDLTRATDEVIRETEKTAKLINKKRVM